MDTGVHVHDTAMDTENLKKKKTGYGHGHGHGILKKRRQGVRLKFKAASFGLRILSEVNRNRRLWRTEIVILDPEVLISHISLT